ncbi:hypothetical protein [Candidatus Uabimicrobium sp. HlEnr_7]|uniref:hypothetical protein n=1 Tax=Candidatus Uabimicrobium helgolandensis TaxID=3095367 RepID=UPI0035578CB3
MKSIFILYFLFSLALAQTFDELKKENAKLKEEITKLKLQLLQSPSIKVVNVREIFIKYQKAIDIKNKIRDSYQKDTIKAKNEYDKDIAKYPIYPMSSRRVNSNLEIRKKRKILGEKFKKEFERLKNILYTKLNSSAEVIFKEIFDEVDLYAKINNISVILKVDDLDTSHVSSDKSWGHPSTEKLWKYFDNRKVLYWKNTMDISPEIIKRLNDSYTTKTSE